MDQDIPLNDESKIYEVQNEIDEIESDIDDAVVEAISYDKCMSGLETFRLFFQQSNTDFTQELSQLEEMRKKVEASLEKNV